MKARELRPRLWYWTAPHPDWTPEQGGEDGWEQEVGSYAYVSPDGRELLLFDPLVPRESEDEFWRSLDEDVERYGPPQVLITCFWHARSADAISDRYEDARVWSYAPSLAEASKWMRVTDAFEREEALPAGIEASMVARAIGEVTYRLPEYDAVVTGDALAAAPGAPVRVWQADEEAVRALLDRPIEMLLLTHGEPVLEGGGEALARALEA
jgi:hypothetical protein